MQMAATIKEDFEQAAVNPVGITAEIIPVSCQQLSRVYPKIIKRWVDLAISTSLIMIASPLLIFVSFAIRLDSPGPVFFKQTRVGKNGKIFTLWKFRSMCQNAEQNGAVWAEEDDPRVTRVGRWMRRLKIDELPQLFNVCCGEMSLVGPRPERPEFEVFLRSEIPFYEFRHTVHPGITGWAQVKYRYGSSVEDARFKMNYDIEYIKNQSFWLDLRILIRTIGVVLIGQGTR